MSEPHEDEGTIIPTTDNAPDPVEDMAGMGTEIGEPPEPEPEPPQVKEPEPHPEPPAPEVEPAKEAFLTGKWKSHNQYSCPMCPYNSLKQSDIIVHIPARHVGYTISAILGPDGKPVVKVSQQ